MGSDFNETYEVNGSHVRNIQRRFVPAKGYDLRVAIFYDDAFKRFAGSDAAAQTKLTGIFNHVKTIYTQFSVSGVSGAVKPSLKSINYRSGTWTADNSLRTVSIYQMDSNGMLMNMSTLPIKT